MYNNGKRKYISVIHNRAVTFLSFGLFLAAGSEDGTISVHSDPLMLLEKHNRPVLFVC